MSKTRAKTGRPLFHPLPPLVAQPNSEAVLRFAGKTAAEFAPWQAAVRHEVLAAMGKRPAHVNPAPQVVERFRARGVVAERVIFAVARDLCASAWICRPSRHRRGRLAGVLCCHGHGPGKDPLVGRWLGQPCFEYHKLIAVRLAAAGFVTITPDRRGYGDRSEVTKGYPGLADLQRLDALYRERGASLLAGDVWDGMRALDVLAAQSDVDPGALGCVGVESGATVAALVAALDARVNGAVLACFARADAAMPGVAQLPALAGRVGPVEVCGLIAPRPLLLQAPEADPTIPLPAARRAGTRVRTLYRLAGAPDGCELRTFDGVLELDYGSAEAWFARWLA